MFDHANNVYDVQDRFLDWPDLNISADARRITQFDDAKYDRLKEPPLGVLKDFLKYADDPEIGMVGHNIINFDVYQLATLKRILGFKEDWSMLERCIDTNALAKAQKLGIEVDKENTLAWQYKILGERAKIKTSLGAMCKELGVEGYDPLRLHDGAYDCEMNKGVFQKIKFSVW